MGFPPQAGRHCFNGQTPLAEDLDQPFGRVILGKETWKEAAAAEKRREKNGILKPASVTRDRRMQRQSANQQSPQRGKHLTQFRSRWSGRGLFATFEMKGL